MEGSLELVDARSYETVQLLRAHEYRITSLAFDPDGDKIATASEDGTARVFEVDGLEPIKLLDHGIGVLGLAFNPDGTRLATGDRDGKIHLWETDTFEKVAELTGHESYVFALSWSPDGETLVSSSGDSTIRLWETRSSELRSEARRERAGIVKNVEPAVEGWLEEMGDAELVASKIETQGAWSERERDVAFQVLLGECVGR